MNEGIHGSHALWLEVVNRIIGNGPRKSILDVCCGGCAVTRHLQFDFKRGIDTWDHPERPGDIWFKQADAYECLRLPMDDPIFDVAIISDGIEHFEPFRAHAILDGMERHANLSIIFVPTNDVEITPESEDPHAHKSSWSAEELKNLGYSIEEYPDWHKPTLTLGALFAWKRNTNI